MRDGPEFSAAAPLAALRSALGGVAAFFARVDPGTHRRIRGLRLVTAYAMAAMLATMPDVGAGLGGATLPFLAGGFALWGSVSEARATRPESSRDLVLLAIAAGLGAALFILLAPPLRHLGQAGPEAVLASGAFCVGYLRRFGVTGAGFGSQIYIGQLLAYGAGLTPRDLPTVGLAVVLAAIGSVVPRLLSGPAEHPPPSAPLSDRAGRIGAPLAMGVQAGAGALLIVGLNAALGLTESEWAITACTYVVAGSATGTLERVRRRIVGTLVGVPVGLAFLPLASAAPLLVWAAAALAMVIYAMALPERYDIACGAYAFTLIATLAVSGEHSVPLLAARAWETLLGGEVGAGAATLLLPLRVGAGEGGQRGAGRRRYRIVANEWRGLLGHIRADRK